MYLEVQYKLLKSILVNKNLLYWYLFFRLRYGVRTVLDVDGIRLAKSRYENVLEALGGYGKTEHPSRQWRCSCVLCSRVVHHVSGQHFVQHGVS